MTSLLQLVLLSVITAVESYPLDGHSTAIPNEMRKSSMNNCDDYKDIRKWFDLQNAAAESLRNHSAHLDEVLGYVNGSKASMTCCFYDTKLMQSVMDNVNKITQQHGDDGTISLNPSGELRTDLSIFIPRIKKLVSMGFKSCCFQMEESLKKLKKDLEKQLENIKEKFRTATSDEFVKDQKELEEKHKGLKGQIKDTKERLHKLEKDMTGGDTQSSCCVEINTKIETLEKQINAARTDSAEKINLFEGHLKDIETKLEAQKNEAKDAKNTLDTQGTAIKKDLESCEKTPDKNNNCCEPCMDKLKARFKELEERIISLIKRLAMQGSKKDIHININACQEGDRRLDKIKDLIENSEMIKEPKSDYSKNSSPGAHNTPCKAKARLKMLEQELEELRQAGNKSQPACENIDKLNTLADHLQYKTDQMRPIYTEHMQSNKLKLQDHKKQINESLSQLDKIEKDAQGFQKLKNLTAMIPKVKKDLKHLEDELNELSYPKIGFELKKMQKKTHHFWNVVHSRILPLESKPSNRTTNDALKPRSSWINQELNLNQGMDRVKQNLKSLQQLEKQYNIELGNLNTLGDQVSICLNACKEIPKMQALLKEVPNLIKDVMNKQKKLKP